MNCNKIAPDSIDITRLFNFGDFLMEHNVFEIVKFSIEISLYVSAYAYNINMCVR